MKQNTLSENPITQQWRITMTLRELSRLLFQAGQYHDDDTLICIFNRDTGERIDIEYVEDRFHGEIRLVAKENNK